MLFGIIGRTSPGMRQVVGFEEWSTGRGTFGGAMVRVIVSNGDFTAYMCDSTATLSSSQITRQTAQAVWTRRKHLVVSVVVSYNRIGTLESQSEIGVWVQAPGLATHTAFRAGVGAGSCPLPLQGCAGAGYHPGKF